MSQHNGAGRAYEWEEGPIEKPNEGSGFVLLPEGKYQFRVSAFERGQFPGGTKIPACKKAILTLECDGGPLGKANVKTDLILHTDLEWKLCQFFLSIGDRKHGEPLAMNWRNVIGKRGWLSIKHKPGKNEGVVFMDVDEFLDPGKAPSPSPVQQPQPAMASATADADGFDWGTGEEIPY